MAKKKTTMYTSPLGEVMTVEERNRRMKLLYVNGGMELKDIGAQYGLTEGTVKQISHKERWKEYKDKFKQQIDLEIEGKLKDVYVNTGVDINIMYNNAWQTLMWKVQEMLGTKEGLLDSKGNLSIYKLNQCADILQKAHQGQMLTSGFMSREVQAKIELQRKSVDMREILAGLGEDEVIQDNFLEALGIAAEKIGMTSEKEKEKENESKE